MGCCALGTCDNPACDLCQRVAKLPHTRQPDRGARYAMPGSGQKPSRDPSKIKRKRKPIHPLLRRSRVQKKTGEPVGPPGV